MTERPASRPLTALLILNSMLLGVMLFFLFAALWCVSTVLDQQVGQRAFTVLTEWAVNFRPKDYISMFSWIIAAVATSLFAGLALKSELESGRSTALYLLIHCSIYSLMGAYFLFFVMAIASSYIHIGGELYQTGHGPPPRPTMIASPMIDSRIWFAVSIIYSLALLMSGIRLARRQRT
jgi:hypothetical protein